MSRFVLIPELFMAKRQGQFMPNRLESPFIKLLEGLPPEAAAFFCGRDFLKNNPLIIEHLNNLKIEVKIDALNELGLNDVVPVDSITKLTKDQGFEIFAALKAKRIKTLFFLFNPEEAAGFYPEADEFVIYTSETQLFGNMSMGRFSLDEQGTPEIGLMPNSAGGQGAAAGFIRPAGFLEGRDEDKEALKKKLAAICGFNFKPNRPLATHFASFHYEPRVFNQGLLKLTRLCNVLLKDLYWHLDDFKHEFTEEAKEALKVNIKAPNFFLVDNLKSTYDKLNQLMRYAADVNLTCFYSGTFVSSIMLGLPTIPVYTRAAYILVSHYGKNLKTAFSAALRSSYRPINLRIMDCLPPVDIEATETLLDMILNRDYWQRYREALPRIQRYAFGRYLLGDAALGRARALILRLLQFGSFLPPGYDLAKTVPAPNILALGQPAPLV